MKKIIFYLVILVCVSCETKWGQYGGYKLEYDSALEYYLVLDKGEIIYADDSIEEQRKKGTMVKYYRSSGTIDTFILGKGAEIVESFIDNDNVCFDSTFILVFQKPIDQLCECVDTCLNKKYGMNANGYDLCKEALKNTSLHQYWIINKQENAIYGPLTRDEYVKQRVVLHIPPNLKLED